MTSKRLWLLLGAALLLADTSVPTGLDSNSTHFLNGLGSWTPASGSLVTNGDSNFAIPAQTSVAATSAAFTLARTWTLPAANAQTAGLPLTIVDPVGGVSATNTLTVARAGADTIDGATTTVLSAAFGTVTLISDGVSKWTISATTSAANPGGSTNAVQYNAGGGAFGGVGPLTNGQIVIGRTGTSPAAGTLTAGAGVTVTNASGAITLAATVPAPQGRLTLQSGHPVMTADQAGVSLLYYDSYVGNLVPVYNGTTDVLLPIGSGEISDTMQTSGTGVLNSGGVFDVWGINVGGTLTLCIATNGSGGGWASDAGSNTARGTGYSALDRTTRPYWTNAHAITHCYNAATDEGTVAINQATYLGTLFTVGAGQTTMQLSFESAAGTANPCMCVFNAYNRAKMTVSVSDSTAFWAYSTATWRESRAQTGNQINWIDGLQVSTPLVEFNQAVQTSAGGDAASIGINLDTASNTPTVISQVTGIAGFSQSISVLGQIGPQIGFHTIIAAEHGFGAGTQTFFGGALMALRLAVDM